MPLILLTSLSKFLGNRLILTTLLVFISSREQEINTAPANTSNYSVFSVVL